MAVYNRLLRACGFDVVDLKNKTHVYGLTGQTGAGKSTVADLLRKQGIGVVDCDVVAREVVQSPTLLDRLAKQFGKDILENGVLNRQRLADRAFASKEATQLLDQIMFPPILQEAPAADGPAGGGRASDYPVGCPPLSLKAGRMPSAMR